MTDDPAIEFRRRLAALADATDRAERLVDQLAIELGHRRDVRATLLDHEARLARLEVTDRG